MFSLLLLFFVLGGPVSYAGAALSGSAEWNYVDYDLDSKNGDDISASSFFQRYSFLYQQSGLIGAGRLGSWSIGLGAEWAAFDSKINGSKFDKDSFKALYSGDLLLAPGGLPFRLHAYSYDLTPATTYLDSATELSRSPYFRPGISTDLRNGQTIVSGVQFLAGIRNGSYLGRYREILSTMPRLLIDYRSIYHRDVEALNKTKFRQRDLAFVSLNKKDNWFHYRVYDFKDYIDPRQDQREETFLLGTIDHLLKRQWIHLTNWIKISTDGSYTMIDDGQNGYGEENRYDVNFFAIMSRNGIQVANFNHYSRERNGSTLTQYLDIPVYFNTRISPDTNLRGQVVVNRWQEKIDSKTNEEEDVYYSTARYETNLRRRIRIDYDLEAEYNTTEAGDAQGMRAEVEIYSNPIARSQLSWYSNLGLGFFYGDSFDDNDTDYLESFATGRVTYALNRSLTMEVSQELVYGSGSIGAYTTSYLVPRSTRGFNYTSGEVGREDDYIRTQTGMTFEHRWQRLSNRLAGLYKYEEDSRQSNYSFELEHRLGYSRKALKLDMINLFSTGDILGQNGIGNSEVGAYQEISSVDDLFRHETRLKYLPNKHWESEFDLNLEWRRGEAGDRGRTNSTLVLLTQRLQRNFYAVNGIIRKLADIEQRVDYEKFKDGYDSELVMFTLAGNYYPTQLLSFGGRFEYRYYDPGRDMMLFSLTAGLHFPKFQVDFDYDYGTDEDHDIVVQRYELNVRKTF